MKKYLFLILLISLIFISGGVALAITEPAYPIVALGNCKDKTDCMNFCNNADNISACVDYGSANGLLSKEEAALSKKVAEKIKTGTMPGNCKTKDECEKFCDGSVDNLDQCLGLAEDLGISGASIEEGKRILKALKDGAQLPGGCKTKSSCETYCQGGEHIDECLDFAGKAGILSGAELEEARKVAPFLKSGQTPGGCTTKDSCGTYCDDSSHADECVSFAEKAGFISAAEAEMARKSGGAGPGGCKSQAACDEYCKDQSHLQECVDFGVKVGAIKPEDVQKIKEGGKMIKDGLSQIPAEAKSAAESCLNEALGGKLQEVMAGSVQITKDQGEKIGPCFENAVQSFIKSQMPSIPSGSTQGPPSGGVQGPPNIPSGSTQGPPSGVQGPPSGTQGPPCSSPEECARMFGPQQ